ncbi:MAG: polysaccharide biosynthesis C-terminal domain-containing protein [Flavobacteriaceae bacterium]|nr:polysaccharide biosynthesis C-terminal domain-containing protein [Flavobacteriaceae bacterium]
MKKLVQLFKQTFIYGLATVFPRIISVLLVRVHTDKAILENVSDYGNLSLIFSYVILFNVILSYGLETSFFRFFNNDSNKEDVLSTSSISIIFTSFLFFALASIFKLEISEFTGIEPQYLTLVLWILVLDALVVIPFAYLRAKGNAIKYSIIKIINVIVYFSLNIFLLIFLKKLAINNSLLDQIYVPNHEISYIFIANLIASSVTLILLIPFYFNINYKLNINLLKKMLTYAFPILISGLAYSINETFDKILLDFILPESVAKNQIGMYAACYKLALFMTLFSTAYKLGIEPFFFKEAQEKSPQKIYALILEVFVILGCSLFLTVIVFADLLKIVFIGDPEYWQAMKIVPIILLANFCLGIYQNLSVWYKITDKTKFGAYISICGAIITVFLNIILIPNYGYVGSAVATLSAYLSMAIISYFLGRRHYPIPYKTSKLSFYIIFAVILSITSFYFFRGNIYIGITCLLLFNMTILIFEKSNIQLLIKGFNEN